MMEKTDKDVKTVRVNMNKMRRKLSYKKNQMKL